MFSGEDPTIAVIIYVDDFEICNPLGTSRKKHKVTAVYWVLADVKRSENIWLQDCTGTTAQGSCKLGRGGPVSPHIRQKNQGTVFSVVADNLGAIQLGELLKASPVLTFADFVRVSRQRFR